LELIKKIIKMKGNNNLLFALIGSITGLSNYMINFFHFLDGTTFFPKLISSMILAFLCGITGYLGKTLVEKIFKK